MNAKWTIGVALVVLGVIVVMRSHRPPAILSAPHQQSSPVVQTVKPVEQTVAIEPVPQPQSQEAPKPKAAPKARTPNPPLAQGNVKPGKEPLHDPDARDALALVGVDPNAEQYWLDAIFDTSLPDNEREDLMEDLNETGFADPKNLTPDDLPLIVTRLQIIQQILPQADPFMQDHLLEAYKDLGNMYSKAGGR